MTDLREAAERLVREAAERQGLPEHVEDPSAIARAVALVLPTLGAIAEPTSRG